MHHVGENLRILAIMVTSMLFASFSVRKSNIERERPVFSWDGFNFAKILSMTLGVFDGILTDWPDFVRYTGAREHRPCQGSSTIPNVDGSVSEVLFSGSFGHRKFRSFLVDHKLLPLNGMICIST